jgi:tripartite ATP-independent transporter DctM subunit
MIFLEACTLFFTLTGLALLGMPLFFAIGCSSLIALLTFHPSIPLEVIPMYTVGGIDSFALLAIPFFLMTGEMMNAGGLTPRIIRFANGLVGSIRGGLAHVNVLTNMIFAGMSGSALADVASVGTVLIPSMIRSGYSPGFSAAISATSAIIGPIIPPSIPFIVYAMLANVSVGKLFLAGIIPGVILGLYLMAMSLIISMRRGYPKEKLVSFLDFLRASIDVAPAFLAPFIIVGGVLSGVFTATEAGAVAALCAFLIGTFVYRELRFRTIFSIFRNTVVNTGVVLILVGVSSVYAWIVAEANIANAIANILLSVSKNPWIILTEINILFLIVGTIMDPLPAMIIFVPLFLPAVSAVGINPVHFGLLVVMNLMIGLCTPPVGYLLYLTSTISKEKVEIVIRECLPFIAVMILALMVCTYWPGMVLLLPNLLGP